MRRRMVMALTRNIRRLGWFCKSEIRCIRKHQRRTWVLKRTKSHLSCGIRQKTHVRGCADTWKYARKAYLYSKKKKHKRRQHRNRRLETPKESCFRFPTCKAWFHQTKNLPSLGISYAARTKAAHALAIKICVEIQWVCLYRRVSGWQKQLAGFLNSH